MNSISNLVLSKFDEAIFEDSNGQDVIYISPENYLDAVQFLKDECEVTMCLDVTAVDFLGVNERKQINGLALSRFEVVSHFISHKRNERIRFIVQVDPESLRIDSISNIFPGVNFGEREVYDMFGVVFDGHEDMTRILMPDEWEGYPLRKDDPPARIPVNFTDDVASSGGSLQ